MEVPLPERVAHDDDRAVLPTASLIVRGRERAAENRRDAEDVEEAAAGQNPVDVFGLAHLLRGLIAGRRTRTPRQRAPRSRPRSCSQRGFVHDVRSGTIEELHQAAGVP